MPLYLVPHGNGRPIVVDKAVLFFGRHPECDIVLTNSRKVSRKHCCLAQVDDRFVLRDLGSMNGVQVNGELVDRDAPVGVGDRIVIGDVEFVLKSEAKGRSSSKKRSASSRNGDSRTRTTPPPPAPAPVELSQEFPVAIPDEDDSFKVEETQRRRHDDSDDVYPLLDPPTLERGDRTLPSEYDDDGSVPEF